MSPISSSPIEVFTALEHIYYYSCLTNIGTYQHPSHDDRLVGPGATPGEAEAPLVLPPAQLPLVCPLIRCTITGNKT